MSWFIKRMLAVFFLSWTAFLSSAFSQSDSPPPNPGFTDPPVLKNKDQPGRVQDEKGTNLTDATITQSPWLGVSRWLANQREVVLCGVLKDGPAGKVGLQTDDTILEIDGKAVDSLQSFHSAIDRLQVGVAAPVKIGRDGRILTVDVTPEPLPPDGGTSRMLRAAENGESWAMVEMGVRLAGMRGGVSFAQPDMDAAVIWFRRANAAGNTSAPYFLGQLYRKGEVVPRDADIAQKMFIKARSNADSNQVSGVRKGLASAASIQLASMCLNSEGAGSKPEMAVRLFLDAADHGSLYAMFKLGELFEKGTHVAHDETAMRKWYSKAAELGYPPAREALQRVNGSSSVENGNVPVSNPKASSKNDLAVASALQGTVADQSPTSGLVSDGRYLWTHRNGFVRYCGDKSWIESFRGPNTTLGTYQFKEVERTNEYVELFDPSRNFWVRLTDHSLLLKQSENLPFEQFYEGQWWVLNTTAK